MLLKHVTFQDNTKLLVFVSFDKMFSLLNTLLFLLDMYFYKRLFQMKYIIKQISKKYKKKIEFPYTFDS